MNSVLSMPRHVFLFECIVRKGATLVLTSLFHLSSRIFQEVSHRVLKGYLRQGFQRRGIRSLMVEVCDTIACRVAKGDFDQMSAHVKEPWEELFHCDRKRVAVTPGLMEEEAKKVRGIIEWL